MISNQILKAMLGYLPPLHYSLNKMIRANLL